MKFNRVKKITVFKNGLMSAIPYLACAMLTAVLGLVSEKIVQRGILSRQFKNTTF